MNRGSARPLAFLALATAAVAAQRTTTGVGRNIQGPPLRPGEQGAPGAQCPTFVVFTAPDGCSSCACSVDARMTDCTRSTCPDPGNYTINECVENALYVGSDGCNSCQCNAWRSFSSCTRNICLLSDASPSPRLAVVSQRPPPPRSSPRRPPRPPPRRTTYAPSESPTSPGRSSPTRRWGSTRRPLPFSTTEDGQA